MGYRVRLFVLLLAIALLAPMARHRARGHPRTRGHPDIRISGRQRVPARPSRLYTGTGLYRWRAVRGDRSSTESRPCAGSTWKPGGLAGGWAEQEYFGEGIAVLGDRIYQLTWKSGICVVFDRETFELLEVFTYQTEGWGLTTDGERLIMSDGTNRLFIRDPETFAELDTIDVYDGVRGDLESQRAGGRRRRDLGQCLANRPYPRIDPETGQVTGWIDLTGLLSESDRARHRVDVLNGIALDPETDRLFVTGKLWPKLFEIESRSRGDGCWAIGYRLWTLTTDSSSRRCYRRWVTRGSQAAKRSSISSMGGTASGPTPRRLSAATRLA